MGNRQTREQHKRKKRTFGIAKKLSKVSKKFQESRSTSAANTKHNSLAYHAVRWAVAAEILRLAKVDRKENIADDLIKLLTAIDRDHLFGNWIY